MNNCYAVVWYETGFPVAYIARVLFFDFFLKRVLRFINPITMLNDDESFEAV